MINKIKGYYKTSIDFIWEWVHSNINNIPALAIKVVIIPLLAFACAIYIGFLTFNILALTAMPVWLIYTAAILVSLPFLAEIGRHHTIGWCATLFCGYSFMLAGSAIIPAIIASFALGFVAETVLYGALAFFETEMNKHSEHPNINKAKHMLALAVAIIVMAYVFKLTSAAIIVAAAPYAVAVLGALGMALGISFFLHNTYDADMLSQNFVSEHIKILVERINSPYNITILNELKYFGLSLLAAVVTFAILAIFPLTLSGAPMLIAALVAVLAGIASQQAIIYAPHMISKAALYITVTSQPIDSLSAVSTQPTVATNHTLPANISPSPSYRSSK
jgi:hypothetical protein